MLMLDGLYLCGISYITRQDSLFLICLSLIPPIGKSVGVLCILKNNSIQLEPYCWAYKICLL